MGRLILEHTLQGHKGRIWGVAWHPKGNVFASCGEDKAIRVWSLSGNTWSTKTILSDGHKRTIREIRWSPCGQFLASASFDATTAIWSKSSGEFECNATLEGHENEVKSVSWSRSGGLLATCSRDKSVWIWEVAGDDEFECAAVLNPHTQDVKRVVWHPTKDILASASYDNTIKMFAESQLDSDWDCTATLSSHTSTVWSIDFDAEGDRLVSCSDDTTLKIWRAYHPGNDAGIATPDKQTVWKCVCTLSGQHSRAIYDVSWCKLTGLIATGCGDDGVRIFKETSDSKRDEPTFEQLTAEESAHDQDVNSVEWNPAVAGQLITCSDDGTIKIWKVTD
ncbi:probable cytosolic iron-sulfur protein assembly protein Ciao1 [Drosophila guanche]|uniref:Probable cytosolic iron-sulfur protein assembly protein Ciao1 n=1 Tax=Drosophila guanche TaxID=7266 RepID=A0A3B0J0U9_DROGU|nr:probable cytosolic iron-sulfur protein assembly protein Ciao1 [Drosophila guanche]SPP74377.1 blast:Probable cytosolic iron-sulfur protein assembly protein Ciao1 [Drosophila guanche]